MAFHLLDLLSFFARSSKYFLSQFEFLRAKGGTARQESTPPKRETRMKRRKEKVKKRPVFERDPSQMISSTVGNNIPSVSGVRKRQFTTFSLRTLLPPLRCMRAVSLLHDRAAAGSTTRLIKICNRWLSPRATKHGRTFSILIDG